MGFEATITPNTTSGLADEGRNLDWAREWGGGYILKASAFDVLVLIGVSIRFSWLLGGCCMSLAVKAKSVKPYTLDDLEEMKT